MTKIELELKPWLAPNFAVVKEGPRPRQEGMKEATSIPVPELPQSSLDGMAEQWLDDLYAKAGKQNPFARTPQ